LGEVGLASGERNKPISLRGIMNGDVEQPKPSQSASNRRNKPISLRDIMDGGLLTVLIRGLWLTSNSYGIAAGKWTKKAQVQIRTRADKQLSWVYNLASCMSYQTIHNTIDQLLVFGERFSEKLVFKSLVYNTQQQCCTKPRQHVFSTTVVPLRGTTLGDMPPPG